MLPSWLSLTWFFAQSSVTHLVCHQNSCKAIGTVVLSTCQLSAIHLLPFAFRTLCNVLQFIQCSIYDIDSLEITFYDILLFSIILQSSFVAFFKNKLQYGNDAVVLCRGRGTAARKACRFSASHRVNLLPPTGMTRAVFLR